MSEHLNRRQTDASEIRPDEHRWARPGAAPAQTLNGSGLIQALHTLFEHIFRIQDATCPGATAGDAELRAWFVALPPTGRPTERVHLT